MRTAQAASVMLTSGARASFSAAGSVFQGDLVLGTGAGSSMTLGGATSEATAVHLRLLGQTARAGVGGAVGLSAGRSAVHGVSGGSVYVDAGTDPAGGTPAEVQIGTASVRTLSTFVDQFLDSFLVSERANAGNAGICPLGRSC